MIVLLKEAGQRWLDDHATRLSAALAFYTMLSIAPLLVIMIKLLGFWFNTAQSAQQHVTDYLQQFVGPQSAEALKTMAEHALQPGQGQFATIISAIVLIFSAGGVFGELQDSMNTVFDVEPKPGRGVMGIVRDRFFSLTLVMGTAFILLVSLVVSTTLVGVMNQLGIGWFWSILNVLVSIAVITALFALIFKFVPDVTIRWKPVCYAALVTSILFAIGKSLLGWYLGRGTTTSVYGAAGSLAGLLLWAYYSGMILFFGAELAQAIANQSGHPPAPAENAVKVSNTIETPPETHSSNA